MKSRDSLIRLKRFQVEEKRRRVTQIETMIAEFSRMALDLDREIALEEQRAGISDISHFAYPTYARAARARRDNLKRSAEELSGQLDEARLHLEEALAELGKAQSLDGRERSSDRMGDLALGQPAELDGMRLRALEA
jgi:flagellar export protein FliJ